MKVQWFAAVILTVLFVTSCDQPPKEAVMTVYHNGNQYEIVERSDFFDEDKAAHLIRYHSDGPMDDSIREAEQADILAIVAQHIDTNKHERIVIVAEEKKGRFFGLAKPREHREGFPAEEVLKYKPGKAKKSN